jgi:predicted RND superfamily exporter protein
VGNSDSNVYVNMNSILYILFFLFWFSSWFLQLLPLLASALEFGSAAAPALTALLKMGSWLSAEEFSVKVFFLASFYIIFF